MGRGDRRHLKGAAPLVLVGRNGVWEASGQGPPASLPVPLGETCPHVPDPMSGGGRGHFGEQSEIGTDVPAFFPEKDGIEADRNTQGIPYDGR